ncbi:HAMP domain-containing histidine kinase [Epilithonimonas sp. JDS]|uniref:sensor histidine kinase n=1 Tax=Epilithonimonas sp. JDS TaxID=2902797 RepID=UPI001E28FCE5|nr:HAMP domain-containing sensor histidine kinase [Epilithonimonas sp. JDS]MCD9854422.1 HAMP domain-containing histidine kinase [Epilithonimonas sp. JDS]
MNRKRNITVILFTFSLIILVALQGFYIYNSYRLEEKDFNRQAKEIASKVMDGMDKFDTDANDNRLVGDFERLKLGITIQGEQIKFPDKIYSSEIQYSQKMESLLRKNVGNSGFEMAMKNEIYSVLDELKNEELLPKGKSITLFQTINKVEKPMSLTESIWSSHQSKTNTDLNVNERYNYLVKSKASYQLLNIQYLVLRKIVPLIIISLLIIILIVYLFYNSIKNLNRQEKKISQLHTTIDSIAHELNTPITTLKFSIVQTSDSETKTLLERQIKRLENIVKSIHHSDSEDILIDKIEMENYFSNIKKTYKDINFNINLDLIKNKVLRQNDFTQMMDNLIDNSVKYGTKNLGIIINENLEIEISDDGIGIPKDDLKFIFDKYYRVSRTENLNINGLGVGLFLVKSIVDKYKGKISVKSNPDKGITFKIQIPNEN